MMHFLIVLEWILFYIISVVSTLALMHIASEDDIRDKRMLEEWKRQHDNGGYSNIIATPEDCSNDQKV